MAAAAAVAAAAEAVTDNAIVGAWQQAHRRRAARHRHRLPTVGIHHCSGSSSNATRFPLFASPYHCNGSSSNASSLHGFTRVAICDWGAARSLR